MKLKFPKMPYGRLMYENYDTKVCLICGSSLKRKFFGLIKTKQCIQPECSNYFDNIYEKKIIEVPKGKICIDNKFISCKFISVNSFTGSPSCNIFKRVLLIDFSKSPYVVKKCLECLK